MDLQESAMEVSLGQDLNHPIEIEDEEDPEPEPVQFNYKSPVLLPGGSLLIEPQFGLIDPNKKGLSKAQILQAIRNKKLALLKNAEVPLLLSEPGELTEEEDRSIQYHRLKNLQRVYVGWPDGDKIFTSMLLDETVFNKDPELLGWVNELRDVFFRRGSGNNKLKLDLSAFEEHVRADNKDPSRSYFIGVTEEQGHFSIGPKYVHDRIKRNPETVARVSHVLARVCCHLLRIAVPEQELKLVNDQADMAVPMTFGAVENNYFSSYVVNYAGEDEISLSATVGPGGGLHVDSKDDPRLWCVFLPLSHLPENTWPGRSIIPSLRIYAPLAPFTAIVSKAVHPHFSLGPQSMANSKRQAYKPAVEGLCLLNHDEHVFGRLATVSFMKKAIFESSPFHARPPAKDHNVQYPVLLPSFMYSFGDAHNLVDYTARAETLNRCRLAAQNSCLALPTAQEVARYYRYRVGNVEHTPWECRIQKVLDGQDLTNENTKAHNEKWEAYTNLAQSVLSMSTFVGMGKEAKPVWVTAAQLGSSFANINLDDPNWNQQIIPDKREKTGGSGQKKIEAIKQQYGPKPFACAYCEKRFADTKGLKFHKGKLHTEDPDFEMEPSEDPDRTDEVEDGEVAEASALSKAKKRKLVDNDDE